MPSAFRSSQTRSPMVAGGDVGVGVAVSVAVAVGVAVGVSVGVSVVNTVGVWVGVTVAVGVAVFCRRRCWCVGGRGGWRGCAVEAGVPAQIRLADTNAEDNGVAGSRIGVAVQAGIAALVLRTTDISCRRIKTQQVGAGGHAQAVFTDAIGHRAVNQLVGVVEEQHRDVSQTRLAAVLDAVSVEVIPDPVTDGSG